MEIVGIGIVIFIFSFLLVAGGTAVIWFLVIRAIVRNAAQNRWNAQQPVVATEARIVAERLAVRGGGEGSMASTWYYTTFELPDGERCELPVSGKEYGLLAEGDTGSLSTQGTAYKAFEGQKKVAV